MGFYAQCTERHGTCHKVLYNALNGFYLVDRESLLSVMFEVQEVADEDRRFLLVNQF